jgi:hypothetical protein
LVPVKTKSVEKKKIENILCKLPLIRRSRGPRHGNLAFIGDDAVTSLLLVAPQRSRLCRKHHSEFLSSAEMEREHEHSAIHEYTCERANPR